VLSGGFGDDVLDGGKGDDIFVFDNGGGHDNAFGGKGFDIMQLGQLGSGGWVETIAHGVTPVAHGGDWVVSLDNGNSYVLHGDGGSFDISSKGIGGVITGSDGTEIHFQDMERIEW